MGVPSVGAGDVGGALGLGLGLNWASLSGRWPVHTSLLGVSIIGAA